MAEHLKLPKEECIRRLDEIIGDGRTLRSAIVAEYRVYVEKDQWRELPEELLVDWGQRYLAWHQKVVDQLQSVFLAASSKVAKFEQYRSAMTSLGPKQNEKFTRINDKLNDKLNVLLTMLEGVEQTGIQQSVTVNNSSGVVVNTGTIEGNIQITANRIKDQGNPEFAKAIAELVDAIKKDASGEIDQESMLKQAEVLTHQATLPTDQRKATLVKAAWSYIEAFSKVATISNFLMSHGKTIATFFGF